MEAKHGVRSYYAYAALEHWSEDASVATVGSGTQQAKRASNRFEETKKRSDQAPRDNSEVKRSVLL